MSRILLALFLVASFASTANGGGTGVLSGTVKAWVNGKVVRDRPVVYLEYVRNPRPRKHKKQWIVQKQRKFTPKWIAVTKGTRVSFPNRDNRSHNVFSKTRGNQFDLYEFARGTTKANRFNGSGPVLVQCNIHESMTAWVLVLKNDYWVKANKRGGFRLDKVPPGNYWLAAWLPNMRPARIRVTVRAGKIRRGLKLVMTVGLPPARLYRKDGRTYGYD